MKEFCCHYGTLKYDGKKRDLDKWKRQANVDIQKEHWKMKISHKNSLP